MKGEIYTFTGSRIKKMRLEKKWTQKELANNIVLKNDTAVANYESGYSIPKDEIKLKMCETFNCSMDYLMGKSFYLNSQAYQFATKQSVSFLKSANKTTLEFTNKILKELIAKTNKKLKQLDDLDNIVYSKTIDYGIPQPLATNIGQTVINLYEHYLETRFL